MRVSMAGVDLFGREVPAPPSLSTTIWLRNPNHISADVSEVITRAKQMFESHKAAEQLWKLIENLDESLEATRYHQRQFLARYRIVEEHYLNTPVSGSAQVDFVMGDVPLKCELEALLIRSRSSLDALAQLASKALGREPEKFGAFATSVRKGRKIPNSDEIDSLIKKHEAWLNTDRDHRNKIAHDGQLQHFNGLRIGSRGIDAAKLLEEDAVSYGLQLWTRLLLFTTELLSILEKSRS
jgi:hypothetical protein